jgi:hypothetical protein
MFICPYVYWLLTVSSSGADIIAIYNGKGSVTFPHQTWISALLGACGIGFEKQGCLLLVNSRIYIYIYIYIYICQRTLTNFEDIYNFTNQINYYVSLGFKGKYGTVQTYSTRNSDASH